MMGFDYDVALRRRPVAAASRPIIAIRRAANSRDISAASAIALALQPRAMNRGVAFTLLRRRRAS